MNRSFSMGLRPRLRSSFVRRAHPAGAPKRRFPPAGPLACALAILVACEKKAEPPPAPPAVASSVAPLAALPADAAPPKPVRVEIPEVRVKKDAATTVKVTWVTPKGTAVNDEAPFRVRWNRSDGLVDAPPDVKATGSAVKDGFKVAVHPMGGAPNATLGGEINIVVCDAATHSVCVPVARSVELGFIVAKDAADEATVSIPLPEARPN